MKIIKICFFGDSICMGQGACISSNWIVRLSMSIKKEFGDIALVSISAVNGRTTRAALENMPFEVQSNPPDILFVQYGMNDCNYWKTDNGVPRVTKDAFKANLEEIILRARASGVSDIFLNSNHPTGRINDKLPKTNITYEYSNQEYNKLIRLVANKSNVYFTDISSEFKKLNIEPNKYLLPKPDLLHLNDFGHENYYNIIKPKLFERINEHIK
tara:strand:- start:22 stop:663 length:642 start_codon:yes stop_codon:yes gene_type:complete